MRPNKQTGYSGPKHYVPSLVIVFLRPSCAFRSRLVEEDGVCFGVCSILFQHFRFHVFTLTFSQLNTSLSINQLGCNSSCCHRPCCNSRDPQPLSASAVEEKREQLGQPPADPMVIPSERLYGASGSALYICGYEYPSERKSPVNTATLHPVAITRHRNSRTAFYFPNLHECLNSKCQNVCFHQRRRNKGT